MRQDRLGLAIGLGLALWMTSAARAQVTSTQGLGSDPFSLYYGWYLPNQAYQAAQPRVEDTINNITAVRQYTALAERQGLFDPMSPFNEEELDPLRPYSAKRGGERLVRPQLYSNSNPVFRGNGPGLYYSRVGRYYPSMRTVGHGPNRNVAVMRSGGRMGGAGAMTGGMSMPSMPGPR